MKKLLIGVCASFVALYASARPAEAQGFLQTDLVSDIPGLAKVTDPVLQNPWGVSFNPPSGGGVGSPFWISDQATNVATLYAVPGANNTLVSKVNINPPNDSVGIPTTSSGPQGPTGTVFNSASPAFQATNGSASAPAIFMFANLNGTIDAWNPGLGQNAFIQVPATGASYTGLALFSPPTGSPLQPLLYAANNAGAGSIDVFNSNFGPASGLAANAFATPAAISALHLVPFNVQVLNGFVYVTYAPAGRSAQQNAALGAGAIAVFNLDGSLRPNSTMIGGHLAAPWGLAIAPSAFGPFAGDLLVGNFSFINSGINIFDPTGTWEGTILIDPGSGNTAGGLWALEVGGGPNNGFPNTLFFTDGINGESDGLFGSLIFATNGVPPVTGVPEPATWAMMLLGFLGLGFAFRQTQRKLLVACT